MVSDGTTTCSPTTPHDLLDGGALGGALGGRWAVGERKRLIADGLNRAQATAETVASAENSSVSHPTI